MKIILRKSIIFIIRIMPLMLFSCQIYSDLTRARIFSRARNFFTQDGDFFFDKSFTTQKLQSKTHQKKILNIFGYKTHNSNKT